MNRKLLVVVGVVALVALAGVGVLVTGFGPAPGGDGGSDAGAFPTEVPDRSDGGGDAGGDAGGGADGATATEAPSPPFLFTIDGIEQCGQTCRDVTSTVTNQQEASAENVTVYTRIFTGNGTDGDPIWQGSKRVGALAAGESHTGTERVELTYGEGYAIQQEDGWITVQTTVQTADQTMTFSERRDVA